MATTLTVSDAANGKLEELQNRTLGMTRVAVLEEALATVTPEQFAAHMARRWREHQEKGAPLYESAETPKPAKRQTRKSSRASSATTGAASAPQAAQAGDAASTPQAPAATSAGPVPGPPAVQRRGP